MKIRRYNTVKRKKIDYLPIIILYYIDIRLIIFGFNL